MTATRAAKEDAAMAGQTPRRGNANREAHNLAEHLEHLAGERSQAGADVQWMLEAAATITTLVGKVDALRDELAAARKDIERLDALQRMSGTDGGHVTIAGGNLREAIDNWMASEANASAIYAEHEGVDGQ